MSKTPQEARARREQWHRLVDVILDSGQSDVIGCLITRLEMYVVMCLGRPKLHKLLDAILDSDQSDVISAIIANIEGYALICQGKQL